MVLNLDRLNESRQQLEGLLSSMLPDTMLYRGISRDDTLNDRETALYDASRVLDTYDDALHKSICGQGVYIRAYHCTRLRNIALLLEEGLKRLDVDRLNEEVIQHVREVLGVQIPADLISQWTKTDSYLGIKQDRDSSTGPHFLLGSFNAFDCISGIGRFCVDGSEGGRDILRCFGAFLEDKDPSLGVSGDQLRRSFFTDTIGALVVCDLPYDFLPSNTQWDIKRELLTAVLYENTRGCEWEGGGSLCLNQDVPGEWLVAIHEAVFVEGRITFPTFTNA